MLTNTKKEIHTKDKKLSDVKVLLSVKANVEVTQNNADNITLQIDHWMRLLSCSNFTS
jgi:hypothetical protein